MFAVGDGTVGGDTVTRGGAVTSGVTVGRASVMEAGVVSVCGETPIGAVQAVSARTTIVIIGQRTSAKLGQLHATYGSKQRQKTIRARAFDRFG